MVILRIFLVGLIALVPDVEKGRMSVVLQEARSEGHPHFPVLIYECKNFTGTCEILATDVIAQRQILNATSKFDARVIAGERIGVLGITSGDIRFSDSTHALQRRFVSGFRGKVPGNRSDAEALAWVPVMKDISPEHGTIKPEHLTAPSATEIAGLLDLKCQRGRVSTFGFVDIGEQVHSFTFKKSKDANPFWDDRQALADVVLVEMPLDLMDGRAEVTFTFKHFVTGHVDTVTLRAAPDERTIDVVLGNLPPYYARPELCVHEPEREQDDHFAMYYRLTTSPVPAKPQIPFKGTMNTERINAEFPSPPVLAFVEAEPCHVPTEEDPDISSSNRPICTQVVLQSQ